VPDLRGDLVSDEDFIIPDLCDICSMPILIRGAQVFGPPDTYGNTKRWDVCVPCWQKGPTVASIDAAVQDDQEDQAVDGPCRCVQCREAEARRQDAAAYAPKVQTGTCVWCKLKVELRDEGWRHGMSYHCEAPAAKVHEVAVDSDDQNLAEHTALTRNRAPDSPKVTIMDRCEGCGLYIEWVPVVQDWTTGINGNLSDYICPVRYNHVGAKSKRRIGGPHAGPHPEKNQGAAVSPEEFVEWMDGMAP
jgi:hypothetical protein